MKRATKTADEARTRAYFYACLARAFGSPPTEESVQAVREIAAELRIAGVADWSLLDLKHEYMDLFVIPNPRFVPPYEAAFSEAPEPPPCRRKPLEGESALAVGGFYLETGMPLQQEPPDHIANELAFLAHAWSREAQAPPIEAEGWRQTRKEFRREHLLPWLGRLTQTVSGHDRLGYYRVALQAAETLLRSEEESEAVCTPDGAEEHQPPDRMGWSKPGSSRLCA